MSDGEGRFIVKTMASKTNRNWIYCKINVSNISTSYLYRNIIQIKIIF